MGHRPPPPAASLPPSSETPEAAAPQQSSVAAGLSLPRPAVRVTTEYDSDSQVFFHKISCRVVDKLAKLRISFMNNRDGEISCPMLRFDLWKRLVIDCDVEAQNALVRGNFEVGKNFQFQAYHDLKEKQGELMMTTTLAQPSYKLALVSAVPSLGLPKARFQFPRGEVSIEEKKDNQGGNALTMNGILKGKILSGSCTAQYEDTNVKAKDSEKNLKLRYCFKDEQMTFIPEIVLPYNAVSMTFKRQFSPSDKLSYCYHFHSNDFNAVYKRTLGEDVKYKFGYDSEVRLGWASLWMTWQAPSGKIWIGRLKNDRTEVIYRPSDADQTNEMKGWRSTYRLAKKALLKVRRPIAGHHVACPGASDRSGEESNG